MRPVPNRSQPPKFGPYGDVHPVKPRSKQFVGSKASREKSSSFATSLIVKLWRTGHFDLTCLIRTLSFTVMIDWIGKVTGAYEGASTRMIASPSLEFPG